MGIAVVIFKVDTTFAQTFCHSSLLQCRLEAEQRVLNPALSLAAHSQSS